MNRIFLLSLILFCIVLPTLTIRLRKSPRLGNSDLLKEINKGSLLEKATTLDSAAQPIARAKIQAALDQGKAVDFLNEVAPSKDGISDAVKQTFIEDQESKKK